MKCECKFNPVTDVCRTTRGLSLDLNKALREGVVKDTGTEPEFNGIDDPRNVRGRFSDTFSAIDERNRLLAADKKNAAKAKEVLSGNSGIDPNPNKQEAQK